MRPQAIKGVLLGFAASLLLTAAPKLAPDLDGLKPGSKVEVIVQFVDHPKDSDFSKVAKTGAKLKRELKGIKAGVFSVPVNALKGLEKNPRILYMSPDRDLVPLMDHAVPALGADLARDYGWDGTGVAIAIIDSGIRPTYIGFLSPKGNNKVRVVASESWDPDWSWHDEYGHGTHVAGIVAGENVEDPEIPNLRPFRGIAPRADLVDLRVLDETGAGKDSDVIAAIDKALELKKRHNIRVINLSLGRPVYESFEIDPLCQAVEAAWNAGIVVVVAAGNQGRDNSFGNEGYGTIGSPANSPYAITVGAMKTAETTARGDDQIASYSSKGPTLIDHVVKPDLVAPGNRIVSLSGLQGLHYDYPANQVGVIHFKLSGTSMAAPMVSGAVALLLQKEPDLTPDQVKAHLMKTATKSFPASSIATDPVTGETYPTDYDIMAVGAGYLDITALLADNDFAEPASEAVSPVVEFDEATGEVHLVTDSSVLWGRNVLWGRDAIWGTSVVWGRSAVIEDNSVLWGRSILWGRSVLWGRSDPDGFSVLWGRESPHSESVLWGRDVEATNVLIHGEE